ncbi:MAG: DUF6062 family protein [Clostridiales bacterium]|nr:DUF6062 family protein [Clostridiales bacterium]
MKEKIYTIPINEAYEADCECPLCFIERKLEEEAVEYELGAAMMEPDHRELSNEKGYCNKHFKMLYAAQNKLPLALVLDTHLDIVCKKIAEMKKPEKSRGLFKKNGTKPSCSGIISSCMVCDKINSTMDRYYRVLIEMWKEDKGFRETVEKSRGFCLPHFEKLYRLGNDVDFLSAIADVEAKAFETLKEDIHRFTLKFDYRNKDMDWGNAKNSPLRTVEKLAGYISEDEI